MAAGGTPGCCAKAKGTRYVKAAANVASKAVIVNLLRRVGPVMLRPSPLIIFMMAFSGPGLTFLLPKTCGGLGGLLSVRIKAVALAASHTLFCGDLEVLFHRG
jgi:hypothetical protein